MKKLILAVSLFMFVNTSNIYGQAMMGPYWLYDNHYQTDKYIINPAFAGNSFFPKTFVSTQRMEVFLRDAPTVHLAGAHGRFGVGRYFLNKYGDDDRKERNAIGGLVFADNNGLYQSIGLKLDYAYIVPLNRKNTTLSLGLGGMLFSKRLRFDKYGTVSHDPLVAENTGNNVMIPDFNFGVLLNHNRLYAGFSISQLLENSYRFSKLNYASAQVYRNYYLMTGYKFVYYRLELEPSIAAGYNFAPESHINNGNFVDANIDFSLKPVVFRISYRFDGFISNALLYRTQELEIGLRWELFSTNASDASFIGIGLMASYTFLPSKLR